MRGLIYCEIISGPRLDGTFRVAMNRTGCPTSPGYFNITGSDVRAYHGWWHFAGFNGRREFMIDQAYLKGKQGVDPELGTFIEYGSGIFPDGSGLQMQIIALVGINIAIASGPFKKLLVNRPYGLTWKAGQRAYILTEPDCKQIWILQSINHGNHPLGFRAGVFDGIESPGEVTGEQIMQDVYMKRSLKVPDGWDYYTTILEEDVYFVREDNMADVLPDYFHNAYTGLVPGTHQWLCRSNAAKFEKAEEAPAQQTNDEF